MKLIVDARWDGDTGIGRVYREIMSRKPLDIECEFLLSNGRKLGSPLSPFWLSKELNKFKGDLFWSPSYMPPVYSKIPYILTVHDVNHLYFYSKFHSFYFKRVLVPLFKRAKKIITVSEFSKSQLLKLGIFNNRIKVIYNGVDQIFFENETSFNLEGKPYILYIGNRRSYKNIDRMLMAFAKSNISSEYFFALSGNKDKPLADLIRSLGIENKVVFLGHIKEKDLPSVYKGACCLIYMSLIEGFGLPVLEAMASGTPVITSNTSSLIEIANDSAITCTPTSVGEIAEAISLLINDNSLAQTLRIKGIENAKKYRWDTTANKTWSLICEL